MKLKLLIFVLVLTLSPLSFAQGVGGQFGMGGKTGTGGGMTIVPPTLYGTPQTFTCSAGVCTQSSTVNLPNGGSVLSANTTYIVFASILGSGSPTYSTPSGWTLSTSIETARAEDSTYVFFKNYTSGQTPPTTLTITSGDAGGAYQGLRAIAYQGTSGFDSGGPQTGTVASSAATYAAPAITTVNTNDVVIWDWAIIGDVGTGSITTTIGTIEAQNTRSAWSANAYAATTDISEVSTGTYNNTLSWTTAQTYKLSVTLAIHP
jgi:hypothetical protein